MAPACSSSRWARTPRLPRRARDPRVGAAVRFGAFILGGAALVEHDTRAPIGVEVPRDCGLLGCLNFFGASTSTTEQRRVRGTMVTFQLQIGFAFDA